jgi:hypothetical protein
VGLLFDKFTRGAGPASAAQRSLAAALLAEPFQISRAPFKRSVSVGGDPSSYARNLRNMIFQNPQQSNRDKHLVVIFHTFIAKSGLWRACSGQKLFATFQY